MSRAFCLVVALFLVGCGGDSESKPGARVEPVCEAGRVVECPCDGGTTATQECKADGSAWGACSCPDPMTQPSLSCTRLIDQTTLIPSDRCPNRFDRYVDCDESVVKAGVCYRTPSYDYCCAQG